MERYDALKKIMSEESHLDYIFSSVFHLCFVCAYSTCYTLYMHCVSGQIRKQGHTVCGAEFCSRALSTFKSSVYTPDSGENQTSRSCRADESWTDI